MRKFWIIIGYLSELAAIICAIDIVVKYKSNIEDIIVQIKHLNWSTIGGTLALLSISIFIAIVLFVIAVHKIIPNMPKRSVVEIIAPFLLPEEELGTSNYERNMFIYYFKKITIIISAIAVSLIIFFKLYTHLNFS